MRLLLLPITLIFSISTYAQNQFKVDYSIIKVDTVITSTNPDGSLTTKKLNLNSFNEETVFVFNTNENGDVSLYNKKTGEFVRLTTLGTAENKTISTSQGEVKSSTVRTLDEKGNEVLLIYTPYFTSLTYLKDKKVLTFLDK